MSVPAARSDPRLRRYPLRRLRLPVAGGVLSVVVPDPGSWLRADGWEARVVAGGEPPYWADVWPGAVAIARWLCRRPDLAGRSALDLGCGLGVAGTAAVRQGALVTFADREAEALAFARFNGGLQGRAPLVRVVQHDWHAGTLAGAFDLVCLADVTYRVVHHGPVLRHLRQCLLPGGLALHADPYRRESDLFLSRLRSSFAVHEACVATHHRDRKLPVRLCLAARTQADLDRWLAATKPLRAADGAWAAPATARRPDAGSPAPRDR